MERIPTPPPVVLQHLLRFAVPHYADRDLSLYFCHAPLRALKQFKLVVKEWLVPMRQIIQQWVLQLFIIGDLRQEIERAYAAAESKGANVTDLHILMNMTGVASTIDWGRILSSFPKLKSLNLRNIDLHNPHFVAVLDAAAVHTRNLESLMLPCNIRNADEDKVQLVLETLHKALRAWRQNELGVVLNDCKFLFPAARRG